MLLVTALTAMTLLISVYVFEAQERMTEEMLSSYVSDLADTFVEEPLPRMQTPMARRMGELQRHHEPRRRIFFRMFSADPSLRSGGLLLLDKNRNPLGGSEGAENLAPLWTDDLPLGVPVQVAGTGGVKYQVVVRQLDSGNYVLVAAGRTNLLSTISRIWNFWLLSVMLSSAAVLVGIALLWRYLVIPLRQIVETTAAIKWGKDMPALPGSKLYEVRELNEVIERSAENAIDKERMRSSYVGDIVQAQEDARKRLARELHDGPLQSVVASIKRIQLAQNGAEPGTREKLDIAEEISQNAANEIRNYCDELSPSWTALGPVSALEEMAERLSAVYEVEISVCSSDDHLELPDEYTLAMIRIFQEAVSNSVRHGKARKIEVMLAREQDEVVFSVADDGTGFIDPPGPDYERLRLKGHRGLSNIHERVQLLGGRMKIEPADASASAGSGCRIVVRVPYVRV